MGYTLANAILITFPSGSFETVIEVPITDDTMVEGTERFLGQIISGGGIGDLIIFAPNATVDIIDNDGKPLPHCSNIIMFSVELLLWQQHAIL